MLFKLFKFTFRDISRPNRFLVYVPGLPYDLIGHCINANIPGQSFASHTSYDKMASEKGVFTPRELPYDLTQSSCELTFMVDQEYRIRSFFDRWQQEVFDPQKGYGYLDEYGKDVKIIQLSRQHIPTYTLTLTKCWPKTMSDIAFDAAAQNTYATFTVSLEYSRQEKKDTLGAVLGALGIERPGFI